MGSSAVQVVAYYDVKGYNEKAVIWLESVKTPIGKVRAKISDAIEIYPENRILIKTGSTSMEDEEEWDKEGEVLPVAGEHSSSSNSSDSDSEGGRQLVTSLINEKPLSILLSEKAVQVCTNKKCLLILIFRSSAVSLCCPSVC